MPCNYRRYVSGSDDTEKLSLREVIGGINNPGSCWKYEHAMGGRLISAHTTLHVTYPVPESVNLRERGKLISLKKKERQEPADSQALMQIKKKKCCTPLGFCKRLFPGEK